MVEPPQGQNRLKSGGYGLGRSAHLSGGRMTPSSVNWAGEEAVGKVCGVPMAMLQEKSWAPHPSNGQQ